MKYTIIIPTYNRPEYLKRLMSYYDDFNVECKIIIADSSTNENKNLNKNICSLFPNLNILHLDDYPSAIDPTEKIANSIKQVSSEYSVLCADDDFIVPNGIQQSIDFLEQNADYTIAYGVYLTFQIKQNKKNIYRSLWTTRDYPISIMSSDPIRRIYSYMDNFSSNPTFYATYRTDFLNFVFEETVKYANDLLFGEDLRVFLTIFYGKAKCIDVLYGARTTSWGSHNRPTLRDYIDDETFDDRIKTFKLCLANHLKEISDIDIGEFNEMVDKWMDTKISNRKHHQSILFQKMNAILNNLELPNWMDKQIRFVYRKLFPLKVPVDFPVYIDNPRYQDDLKKIRKYVEKRY